MDRAALRLVEILDDESMIEVGGEQVPRYDLQTKVMCFDKGQAWLSKRKNLMPKDDDEGALVQDMRAWLETNPEEVRKLFSKAGIVVAPEKKPGRPTKEQSEVRRRYDAAKGRAREAEAAEDDSGWQKMMGGEA
jgi:hypothetical protein